MIPKHSSSFHCLKNSVDLERFGFHSRNRIISHLLMPKKQHINKPSSDSFSQQRTSVNGLDLNGFSCQLAIIMDIELHY
jgi:hypothetical protein